MLRGQPGDAGWPAGGSLALTDRLPLVRQLAVEALEQEKRGLQTQIAQVLEGRQQLAHLKMSLSLEVATYRYRLARPTCARTNTHTCVQSQRLLGPRGVTGSGGSATTRLCDCLGRSFPHQDVSPLSPPAPLWGQDQRSVLCPGNPQGEVVLWSGTAEEPGWTLVRLLPPDPAPGTACH